MQLTELERAVLEKLLEGEHPVLRSLRQQVGLCTVVERTLSGIGFFTEFAVPPGVLRAALEGQTAPFGDVVADIPALKHGAGFLLYVKDGALDMLEGYTFDGPWPDDTSGFTLRHDSTFSGFPRL